MPRAIQSVFLFLCTALAACGGKGPGGYDAATQPDLSADGAVAPLEVTVLAQFDGSKGQLSEGLWEVSPPAVGFVGSSGTPIVSWAPAAAVSSVGASGMVAGFASLSSAAQATYTLGLTTDASGNVYVAVAAAAAPPNDPAPGIYKLAPGGGTATLFSAGSNATPAMAFANGLDFIGSDLFVADSEGVIYKVGANGVSTVWSQDPLLAPSTSACAGKVPLPIGANGIVHDVANVYVTNTDYGRLIRIPINADGSAGTASVIAEDCARLVGADGLLIDPQDGSFIIALNVLNQIVRVSKDGSAITVLASGGALSSPATVLLDRAGSQRRLLVTSSAFFASTSGPPPSLGQLILP